MILRMQRWGQGTLRVNASHHAACRTSHAGRDARVSRRQQHSQLRRSWPPADVWPGRAHLARSAIPAAVEERQGRRAPLSSQDQRSQPAADYSSDSTVSPQRRRAGEPTPTAAFPDPLHPLRHRPAGRGRRCPRRALRAGGASHSVARVQRLRQEGVSAVGLVGDIYNLRRSAAIVNTTITPRPGRGVDRRAAQATASPATSGRHGQGDTETRQGLYHINAVDTVTQWQWAVAISEAHLLEAILHRRPTMVGVSQSSSRETVEQAVGGRVRRGRTARPTTPWWRAKTVGGAQALGHEPIAAEHATEFNSSFQSLLELPSSLPVEVSDNGRLSARRLPHALRKAAFPPSGRIT